MGLGPLTQLSASSSKASSPSFLPFFHIIWYHFIRWATTKVGHEPGALSRTVADSRTEYVIPLGTVRFLIRVVASSLVRLYVYIYIDLASDKLVRKSYVNHYGDARIGMMLENLDCTFSFLLICFPLVAFVIFSHIYDIYCFLFSDGGSCRLSTHVGCRCSRPFLLSYSPRALHEARVSPFITPFFAYLSEIFFVLIFMIEIFM